MVIKFFVLDELTPKEIHPKLTKIYRNSAPSISTIKNRQLNLNVVQDDPCEGWPKTATTLETIEKVLKIALAIGK